MSELVTVTLINYLTSPYIEAILILAIFVIAALLINILITGYLNNFAKRTKTKVDDYIFSRLRRPVLLIMTLFGLRLGIQSLGFADGLAGMVIDGLVITTVGYSLATVYSIIIGALEVGWAKKTPTKVDDNLLPIIKKAGVVFIWLVTALVIIKQWGINITPFLSGLGIAGIVIGLAIKDALANVFGGIALILDSAVNVGDKIKLDSGEAGTIKEIGLRSTKIVTFDNEVLIIPNGIMANTKIQNYVQPDPSARVNVEFGVEYGADVVRVRKVTLGAIKKIVGILTDPAPSVDFRQMGESALQFTARFWVPSYRDAYGKKMEATEKIYQALNKAKIVIPFPTRTVYLRQDAKSKRR